MDEKVSIIIPVYNCEMYIKKCLDSVLLQTYKNIEVIIIDDGSTDMSRRIINEYIKKDERIKLITQKNMGASQARNNGINFCNGEYIVFLDGDDTLNKYYVEKLYYNICNLDVDIVCCGYSEYSKYGVTELNDYYIDKNIIDKDEFINFIFKGLGGTLWGKIFKKELIDKYYIKLNPSISVCEDMVFLLEYCMKCNRYGAIEENLYNYNRLNEKSITSNINHKYLYNYFKVINTIKQILLDNKFSNKFIDSIITKKIIDLIVMFSMIQESEKNIYFESLGSIYNFSCKEEYINKLRGRNIREKIILFIFIRQKFKLLNLFFVSSCKTRNFKNKFRSFKSA